MKRRSKLILVSVTLALVLVLSGGLLLSAAQGGSSPLDAILQMAPHGMGSHVGGSARWTPSHLPRIVERDIDSNCDRLFYRLMGDHYKQVYLRCRFGNSTQDYSIDYRNMLRFFATLDMTATVGTDPTACAADSNIVAADGSTVYYCYTVTNLGNIPLPLHTLQDSVDGVIFSAEPYTLTPGASVSNVDLGYEISGTVTAAGAPVVRIGEWTGYVDGGVSRSVFAAATVDVAALDLAKTVSLTPNTCGTTNVINPVNIPAWPRYCYTVSNTGSITLPVHTVEDSELGTILSGFAYDLGPGQSYYTVTAVTTGMTVTTTNVATWTASVAGVDITGTATATVNIPPAP